MKKSLLSLIAIGVLASTAATASEVRTSGFINIVGGVNDKNGDNDPINEDKDPINGYDNQYDFQQDSLAAIQFSTNIADNMGATIQLIAQKSEVGDDIRMEWGYVSYDLNDEIRILAGRVRPSLFLYSNYLDVGYAYTWITPPSEVYYQAQITNLDGVNASYTLELDDSTISLNVYGGNSTGDKLNPSDSTTLNFDYDNVVGAELAFSNDFMKLRAGYTAAHVTNTNSPVAGSPLEPYLGFTDSAAAFYGAGLSIDWEDILFATEYIVRDMDETVAPDVQSYYAMIGYKIGDFTPSYTYAVADSDMEFEDVPGSLPDGTPIKSAINGARAGQLDDRTTHTIGLRYDLNSAAAIKAEYSMSTITTSAYAGGTSLTETDEDVNTIRVALNVVF
jgi:hypothetical protein